MPELPEVETTRRGISPLVVGRRVETVLVRQPKLRWLISPRSESVTDGSTDNRRGSTRKVSVSRNGNGSSNDPPGYVGKSEGSEAFGKDFEARSCRYPAERQ